jgi:hypothetical protein
MTPGTHALLSALLPTLFPRSSPATLGAGLELLRDHDDVQAMAAAVACALAEDTPREMYRYRCHPVRVGGPAAERLRPKPSATAAQRARYSALARQRIARRGDAGDETEGP